MSFTTELVKSSCLHQLKLLLKQVSLTPGLVDAVASFDASYDDKRRLRWIYKTTNVRCSSKGIRDALSVYYASEEHEREDSILKLFIRYHGVDAIESACYYTVVHQPWGDWAVKSLLSHNIPFDQNTVNIAAYNGITVLALRLLELRPDLDVGEMIEYAKLSGDDAAESDIMEHYTYDGKTYARICEQDLRRRRRRPAKFLSK